MFLFLCVALLLLLLVFLGSRKPRGYPPGPPRWPLVGSLPYLERHLPHKLFSRFSSTYGPVVGLYFGTQPAAIVNGWEAVKESIYNEDLNGRPELLLLTLMYNTTRRGVMFTEKEHWREQRRFVLHHFRNLGFGKRSHEAVVLEEASELVEDIRGAEESHNLQVMLGVSSVNIMWALMGGTRFGHKDKELQELVSTLNKMFRAGDVTGGLVSSFPALRYLMSEDSEFNTLFAAALRIRQFLENAIEEHKNTIEADNVRDFIDIYINEINKNKSNPDTTFIDDQLLQVCTDMFTAGVETGSSTVSFAILLTTLYPLVAAKIQQELDEVVGHERLPCSDDRSKLVYTEAVMNEVFRLRGAAPITVPHKALKDTILQGHRIPAGTTVLNNLYSVHMDPDYWVDPEIFRPERFINPDGTLRKEERLIPFSKGRRACLGESLARMSSFLLFTALLQHFTFTLDPKTPIPDTEGKSGFTLGPPEFRVFAKPRF
ncbi:methyl farnesoate epoxidase-like [Panulirus ornatus]|uniref:methyl farnesoate epoxidase-like n=1 Tax=Panulirus ornatus TaxID=150431 RepID=UPI003A8A8570